MTSALTPDEIETLIRDALLPYYQLIGEIASIWATFEQRLDHLIWDLMDVEQALGACLTTQLFGPTPRFNALKALLAQREWPEAELKKVNILSDKIRNVQDERNRVVHDTLLVGSVTSQVYKRTVNMKNSKVTIDVSEHSIDNLKEICKKSLGYLKEFNSLQERIRSSVPVASHDTLQRLHKRQGPPSEHRLVLDPKRQELLDPDEASHL